MLDINSIRDWDTGPGELLSDYLPNPLLCSPAHEDQEVLPNSLLCSSAQEEQEVLLNPLLNFKAKENQEGLLNPLLCSPVQEDQEVLLNPLLKLPAKEDQEGLLNPLHNPSAQEDQEGRGATSSRRHQQPTAQLEVSQLVEQRTEPGEEDTHEQQDYLQHLEQYQDEDYLEPRYEDYLEPRYIYYKTQVCGLPLTKVCRQP